MGTAPRVALVAVLCVAAYLRLFGLDQGVRRGSPAGDEMHNFVLPIHRMWTAPTADPTVRPGYPGLFNVLAFLPVGLGERLAGERGAYVAARGLGALFGLVNVFLAWRLGRALAGEWPAVFAASLLAVSRGEVSHAHYVTPDLLVITGVLLLLIILGRAPLTDRTAVLAGVVCGLSIAVKLTAVAALPAAAVALLRGARRRRHALLLGAAAVAAFALAAPYAFLPASPQGSGLVQVVKDYYSPTGYAGNIARSEGQGRGAAAGAMIGYVRQNLGLAGLALAAAGLVAPRGRARLPLLAALATGLAMAVPAMVVYPRHVLVPSALLAVLAGCGLGGVEDGLRPFGDRLRRAAVVTLAGLALLPLGASAFALAARFRAPDALDQAGTWMEKNLPGHPLVASGYPRFALADRFEVRYWCRPNDAPLTDVPPAVLQRYDVVVGSAADLEDTTRQGLRFRVVQRFTDGAEVTDVAVPEPGPALLVLPATVEASEDEAGAARAWSGTGSWRSATGTGWLAGGWEAPRVVTRVELAADAARGFTPQGVVVEGRRSPDARWQRLRGLVAAPADPRRAGPGDAPRPDLRPRSARGARRGARARPRRRGVGPRARGGVRRARQRPASARAIACSARGAMTAYPAAFGCSPSPVRSGRKAPASSARGEKQSRYTWPCARAYSAIQALRARMSRGGRKRVRTMGTPSRSRLSSDTGSTEASTTRTRWRVASSAMVARFPSMVSRLTGPVFPAMSFVPARMTTTSGARSITSGRKRRSICDVVWPPMPRLT